MSDRLGLLLNRRVVLPILHSALAASAEQERRKLDVLLRSLAVARFSYSLCKSQKRPFDLLMSGDLIELALFVAKAAVYIVGAFDRHIYKTSVLALGIVIVRDRRLDKVSHTVKLVQIFIRKWHKTVKSYVGRKMSRLLLRVHIVGYPLLKCVLDGLLRRYYLRVSHRIEGERVAHSLKRLVDVLVNVEHSLELAVALASVLESRIFYVVKTARLATYSSYIRGNRFADDESGEISDKALGDTYVLVRESGKLLGKFKCLFFIRRVIRHGVSSFDTRCIIGAISICRTRRDRERERKQ